MKVAIAYVFPTALADTYVPLAQRFVSTYIDFPPGAHDHELCVVVNGGIEMGPWSERVFKPLVPRFIQHNNYGKDIGAFRNAADQLECDLLICFGSHIHFWRAGWLDWIVKMFEENGPAVYGAWGFPYPNPHIRTTAFWLPPELLVSYPHEIPTERRYEFEHGGNSITLWSRRMGFIPKIVTWAGCFDLHQYPDVSPDNCLVGDQHTGRHFPKK